MHMSDTETPPDGAEERDGFRRHLAELGLDPPGRTGPVGGPGMVVDATTDATRRDAVRGAMLGTAVGDALGRPAETHSATRIREEFGRLVDYRPWRGWRSGPVGTWTDDTQMTLCVAESLIARGGRIDPVDLTARFMDWLPGARGAGRTCIAAVRALRDDVPWWLSGVDSAGNGAAMRVAPIGIVHTNDLDALRLDAAVAAVPTHANAMAVVSAVAHAWLVARLIATPVGALDPDVLVADLCDAVGDLADPGEVEREWRARGLTGEPVRLVDRLAAVPEMSGLTPTGASDRLYCGAFVLESLPMSLWHFLHAPDDAEAAITNAVATGHDADTVASMTGAYAGAYLGASALPARWCGDDLEDADRIVALADALGDLARSG